MASFTMDGTTIFSKSGSDITYANGTLGSGTIFPSGHILQVVTTVDNTEYGVQTGTTPYNYSELNSAITLLTSE